MKKTYIPNVIKACYLSFYGTSDKQIANQIGISPPMVSHWRKHEAWQKTEARLIEKQIEKEINQGNIEELDASQEGSQ